MYRCGRWPTTTRWRCCASTVTALPPGNATLATEMLDQETLDGQWLPNHRWGAEIDGIVVGWATLSPVSGRDCAIAGNAHVSGTADMRH